MRIQHNIMAMNAYRNYTNNTSALSANLEKLSSGYKINRAGDDAAGLAISEKMRAQITGLDKAQDNAKDGISLVQTAEGALTEVHDMLNRMYELAEQSANGTYDGTDRTQLQKEVNNLRTEIDRIADSANFNGIELLNGDMSTANEVQFANGALSISFDSQYTDANGDIQTLATGAISFNTLATGAGAEASATITVTGGTATLSITLVSGASYSATDIQDLISSATVTGGTADANLLTALRGATVVGIGVEDISQAPALVGGGTAGDPDKALTLQIGDTSDDFNQLNVSIKATDSESLGLSTLDISTQEGAAKALDAIKAAINYVSDVRGTLGATQNRLDHTINNLSVMEENIQDAESTIRDTDVAEEMMAYTKNNILIQSAQAMLAQANQVPQGVLQLLQ